MKEDQSSWPPLVPDEVEARMLASTVLTYLKSIEKKLERIEERLEKLE
jgi:hypothetical protein